MFSLLQTEIYRAVRANPQTKAGDKALRAVVQNVSVGIYVAVKQRQPG